MANTITSDQRQFAITLRDILNIVITSTPPDTPVTGNTTKKKASATPTAAPEPKGDDAVDKRRAELGKKSLKALVKIAVGLGYEEDDFDTDKDEVIESIIEAEAEAAEDTDAEDDADTEDDSDDEAADDEDEAEDEEGLSYEDAVKMNLKSFRVYVRDNYEADDIEAAGIDDIKKADRDALLAFLFPDGDDDDADEDADDEDDDDADDDDDTEDDDDDDSDDDDDDDEEELDEDDLRAMSLAEVKKVAKQFGIKVTPKMTKDKIVTAILDASEVDF